MNPLTCPLAAKQPLADLTAESARNAVKTFEGLDYSPEEASTAAYVEEQITKHSRLGFTQCVLQDMKVSDKMRTYLESKGFHVATFIAEGYTLKEGTRYGEGWKVFSEVHISWGGPITKPPYRYDSEEDRGEQIRQRRADTVKAVREKQAADLEIAQALGYKQPAPTPPPSGCLPLLLALPTAIYFLLS